jgi:hypothetical protein
MATMISWRPQGENFLEIQFGEEWTDADADFKNVLNSLGKDFLGKQTGDRIGGFGAAVPLPGFTESLQRQILTSIGLMEDDPNVPLPSGNPNLIKEAKRRKTLGYEGAGSGLKCTVSIKMDCEWEQKFLSGIDPTIVFQDLINKILVFSTSKSSNYGLTPKFEQTISKWTNDPGSILGDMVKLIKDALEGVKKEINDAIKSVTDTFNKEEAAAAEAKAARKAAKEKADLSLAALGKHTGDVQLIRERDNNMGFMQPMYLKSNVAMDLNSESGGQPIEMQKLKLRYEIEAHFLITN